MKNEYYIDNSKEGNNYSTQNIENNNRRGDTIIAQNATLIVCNPIDKDHKGLKKESENKHNVVEK